MAVRAAEREPAVVPAQRQAKGSRLRGVQGGAVNESPEGPGTRDQAEGVQVGGEGGTSRGNCEKWGWESPLEMTGPAIPALLTCVLTLFCANADKACARAGQSS